MKKVLVLSFLICFIFSSFAHNSVKSIKIEKLKTEKVVFETIAVSNEISKTPVIATVFAINDVGKLQSDFAAESDSKFLPLQKATYNYDYHWCRNKENPSRYPKDFKA